MEVEIPLEILVEKLWSMTLASGIAPPELSASQRAGFRGSPTHREPRGVR
jgi:hypothetical protein